VDLKFFGKILAVLFSAVSLVWFFGLGFAGFAGFVLSQQEQQQWKLPFLLFVY
jgi:hypothetical protein